MKDLYMIPVILAVFALSYCVILKVDRFIYDNQRLIAAESRNGKSNVRIAAETPELLDAVASALECCSIAEPHIGLFLSSANIDRILQKLSEERVDIVLMSDINDRQLEKEYASLTIPYGRAGESSASDNEAETHIRVVWKKSVKSKDRDRVIFALENDHYRLKRGYADYLD